MLLTVKRSTGTPVVRRSGLALEEPPPPPPQQPPPPPPQPQQVLVVRLVQLLQILLLWSCWLFLLGLTRQSLLESSFRLSTSSLPLFSFEDVSSFNSSRRRLNHQAAAATSGATAAAASAASGAATTGAAAAAASASASATTTNRRTSKIKPRPRPRPRRRRRLLYIVTSGGKNYKDGNGDRFVERVVPIVLDTVQSILSLNEENNHNNNDNDNSNSNDNSNNDNDNNYYYEFQVDVYLVLGYDLDQEHISNLQDALNGLEVDLGLGLGLGLEEEEEEEEEDNNNSKPGIGVGLEIWQNAIPMGYNCDTWLDEPAGFGTSCQGGGPHKSDRGPMENSKVRPGNSQLARQHRYVLKDKLPYYDFFLAFEDDMRVTKYHVQQHLNWMTKLRNLQQQQHLQQQQQHLQDRAAASVPNWKAPQLSLEELRRMRPGFIRVEVLQPDQQKSKGGTREDLVLPVNDDNDDVDDHNHNHNHNHNEANNSNSNNNNSNNNSNSNSNNRTLSSLDPNICCSSKHLQGEKTTLVARDLVIWETDILAMSLRKFGSTTTTTTTTTTATTTTTIQNNNENNNNNENSNNNENNSNDNNDWIAILPGPPGKYQVPGYWPGDLITPKPRRPPPGDSKRLGQSAGWMASAKEVMEYHTQLCTGGFVPPFDVPKYQRDGLWRNNVEYWSGGIQLWCGTCGISRFLVISEFDRHLLYHSTNNKQFAKPRQQLTLAQDLHSQLQLVQRHVQEQLA